METYKEDLLKAGLNDNQASIYEFLIKNGSSRASRISRAFEGKISRTMIYALLDSLVEAGLIEKNDPKGEVARFTPTHPSKLQEFAERRRQSADLALSAAASAIPKILSDYNLMIGKPGVRFFEGDVGMRAVLEDSLTAKTEIYSYADLEAIEQHIPEINADYVREREKKNIKKKAIVPDTPYNREKLVAYHRIVTDAKILNFYPEPLKTVTQIYDNKVSYLTFGTNQKIGIIIEDPSIYMMHRHLFEYLWNTTPEITPLSQPQE